MQTIQNKIQGHYKDLRKNEGHEKIIYVSLKTPTGSRVNLKKSFYVWMEFKYFIFNNFVYTLTKNI